MKKFLLLLFTIILSSCSTKYILVGEKYKLGCNKGMVSYQYISSDTLRSGDTITIIKKKRVR